MCESSMVWASGLVQGLNRAPAWKLDHVVLSDARRCVIAVPTAKMRASPSVRDRGGLTGVSGPFRGSDLLKRERRRAPRIKSL